MCHTNRRIITKLKHEISINTESILFRVIELKPSSSATKTRSKLWLFSTNAPDPNGHTSVDFIFDESPLSRKTFKIDENDEM